MVLGFIMTDQTESPENERKAMFKEAVRNIEYCAELVIKQLQGKCNCLTQSNFSEFCYFKTF